jgi:hypothetical protein
MAYRRIKIEGRLADQKLDAGTDASVRCTDRRILCKSFAAGRGGRGRQGGWQRFRLLVQILPPIWHTGRGLAAFSYIYYAI